MTTTSKQPTKESPRKYHWLVFYIGIDHWGNTCQGRANVVTEADLFSKEDSSNSGISTVESQLKDSNQFQTLTITNIIERR